MSTSLLPIAFLAQLQHEEWTYGRPALASLQGNRKSRAAAVTGLPSCGRRIVSCVGLTREGGTFIVERQCRLKQTMTNYSKWDKFAADVASDTDGEEEQELSEFAKKEVRYIHIPPKDFSRKPQLCRLLEEAPDFEQPTSQAAGVLLEEPGASVEPGVARALEKYGWTSIGSQLLPGYGAASQGDDLWRIFFDDNFLTTQKQPNPGARALLGYASLGSFVVACLDRKAGEDRLISRKEVADLIMRRQQGGDAERIALESERQKESMKVFDELGAQKIELKS
eukprot:TRINITY_DN12980_c0_g1_i1.p1 TRINITY_DN12980_c0_g1~~TRINITY_DN12980_c0_g1_i1.p1  ORF type:complete len:281 (-),score=41.91 TRINITY_DN12980_c0_g1_i1:76-918(-)